MNKFYFTYGTSELYPFKGGWTEIVAPDRSAACAIFRMFHPNSYNGCLNCSEVYSRDEFVKTGMYKEGNFGVRAHEVITLKRKLLSI
ncbi:MAG: hypothetical protein ACI4WX_17195 [Aristaeellaceae bacterium]